MYCVRGRFYHDSLYQAFAGCPDSKNSRFDREALKTGHDLYAYGTIATRSDGVNRNSPCPPVYTAPTGTIAEGDNFSADVEMLKGSGIDKTDRTGPVRNRASVHAPIFDVAPVVEGHGIGTMGCDRSVADNLLRRHAF